MVYHRKMLVMHKVSQGSVHGPGVFKIFVNDLLVVLNSGCLFYVDDMKLWYMTALEAGVDKLQASLHVPFK